MKTMLIASCLVFFGCAVGSQGDPCGEKPVWNGGNACAYYQVGIELTNYDTCETPAKRESFHLDCTTMCHSYQVECSAPTMTNAQCLAMCP
jgi:hypothetical protein